MIVHVDWSAFNEKSHSIHKSPHYQLDIENNLNKMSDASHFIPDSAITFPRWTYFNVFFNLFRLFHKIGFWIKLIIFWKFLDISFNFFFVHINATCEVCHKKTFNKTWWSPKKEKYVITVVKSGWASNLM